MSHCRFTLPGLAALTLFAGVDASAQSRNRPQPTAVVDVRLDAAADAPPKTLVLREGRIESVLDAGATLPPGLRLIAGEGRVAVPAFIDAFTQAGFTAPAIQIDRDVPANTRSDVQIDMREANRKGIAPAVKVAELFNLAADKAKGYRESGFGWLLSAPAGELLGGTSSLATTREAAARDQIVLPAAFAHGEFRASGPGFPGTPMGFMSQLRQAFLDAQRLRELQLRHSQNRPGLRPPFDPDLAAMRPILARERRLMCAADGDLAIERWIALSDEFGIELAVAGGRDAHRIAATLAERRIPVVLTLDWGEEVKDPHEKDAKKKEGEATPPTKTPPEEPPKPVGEATQPAEGRPGESAGAKADDTKAWEYEEPLGTREHKRRRWEEGRDCAMALHAAGVSFAFGSASSSPAELVKKVRTLVEKGLPREAAMAGLCSNAAGWLGLGDRVGAIAPGKDATFALWTDDPLGKDAQVAWMFVDGFPHEFEVKKKDAMASGKPKEGTSAAGTWSLTTQGRGGARVSTLVLEMTTDGDVSGTWTLKNPRDDAEVNATVSGHLGGTTLTLEGKVTFGEREIEYRLSGELEGDEWKGDSTSRGGFGENTSPFQATRTPKQADR